jgi:hypothetical protein
LTVLFTIYYPILLSVSRIVLCSSSPVSSGETIIYHFVPASPSAAPQFTPVDPSFLEISACHRPCPEPPPPPKHGILDFKFSVITLSLSPLQILLCCLFPVAFFLLPYDLFSPSSPPTCRRLPIVVFASTFSLLQTLRPLICPPPPRLGSFIAVSRPLLLLSSNIAVSVPSQPSSSLSTLPYFYKRLRYGSW